VASAGDAAGPVPDDEDFSIPFGVADIKRPGGDVTVFASSWMVLRALEAAETLSAEGVDVEVVDPRTLSPLDERGILESVAKTGRLVVVDECHRRCSVAAEIMAVVAENSYRDLVAPPVRVTTADVPVPFSPPLEQHIEPTTGKIVGAVREATGLSSG